MIYFITKQQFIESEDIMQGHFDDLILYLQNNNEVGIDTETTGFDPFTKKLLSIQLGDFDTQYFVDWSYLTNNQLLKLKKELEDTNKIYLLQNAKFDLRFLLVNNIDIKNVYDTFLAECVLTTGLTDKERDTSLKGIVNKYCGMDLDKTVRGEIHKEGLSNKVVRYGANDVKYLKPVKDAQMSLIKKWQLENVLNLENEVVRIFAKIENNGVLIDSDKWLNISKIVEKEKIRLESELDKIVFNLCSKNISKQNKLSKYCNLYKQPNLFFDGIERDTFINWSSPSQKLKVINDLGVKISSTSDKDLQLNKHKHPLIGLLLEHAKVNKLESSFGKKFLNHINPNTGRVHYNIWQILSTGRISVSEPNLNQIPSHGEIGKEIRSCFIPKKGYKIVGGDYSAMELRIIAEFSQDETWVNAFINGEDLHSKLCSMTFDIDIKDVKKPFPSKPTFTYRDVQKTLNFGLAYGMSEFKLADTLQITKEEAVGIINKFFSRVPKVQQFLDTLAYLGRTRGYIRTGQPYGRVRFFPEYKNSDNKILSSIERKSKNSPIQGTNGDVIKRALCLAQKEIDDNNYDIKILLTVYDEIQTECVENLAEEWCKILESCMIKAAQESIKSIPIIAECNITECWQK